MYLFSSSFEIRQCYRYRLFLLILKNSSVFRDKLAAIYDGENGGDFDFATNLDNSLQPFLSDGKLDEL